MIRYILQKKAKTPTKDKVLWKIYMFEKHFLGQINNVKIKMQCTV